MFTLLTNIPFVFLANHFTIHFLSSLFGRKSISINTRSRLTTYPVQLCLHTFYDERRVFNQEYLEGHRNTNK